MKPRFKLFEIDWETIGRPMVKVGENEYCTVHVADRIEGYRIFGFTDNDHFSEVALLNGYKFVQQPCNHSGNRKYAIGRLEVSEGKSND